jgi:hypothetical protein
MVRLTLVVFCFVFVAIPVRAQHAFDTVAVTSDRSATVATAVAVLVPGAGHVYAGEWLRGIGFYLETAQSFAVGLWIYRRPSGFGALRGVAVWAIGVVDARHAIERRLTRRRSAAMAEHLGDVDWHAFVVPGVGHGSRVAVGLTGSW